MSIFEAGYYTFRPDNVTPEENISTGPPDCTCPQRRAFQRPSEILVTVDKNPEVWEVTGEKDRFKIFSKPTSTGSRYAWVARGEILFATLNEEPGIFKIDSAGSGLWHIGVVNDDEILTYDKDKAKLTLKHAVGSPGQSFIATLKPKSSNDGLKKKKVF